MTAEQANVEAIARLLDFINHDLPRLDRKGRVWSPVDATTPLFATGLLDSMSIVHLITFIEQMRGELIPDQLIVMKNFQNANAMAEAFLHS